MTVYFVEAFTISIGAPGSLTFNGTTPNGTNLALSTRNINFTFTPVWSNSGENTTTNCSLWINSTAAGLAWNAYKNVSVNNSVPGNDSIINNTVSYMNFTFTQDGNYTYAIACYNVSNNGSAGPYTLNFSTNTSFFIDTVAPQIIGAPNGIFRDYTQLNITSINGTDVFYINVTDNSTTSVFVILNNFPFAYAGMPAGISVPGDTNESVNRSMTLDRVIASDKRTYNFSIGGLLNFSSNFTGPGPHGITFCANDSLGRITCTNKTDFIIKGMEVSGMERQFGSGGNNIQNIDAGFTFSGLDIRYGNGTDVPAGTFMNPTAGNFTFNMNLSANTGIFVVGARIDENNFANASHTNYSGQVTTQIRSAAGNGFRTTNSTWVDIKNFIPSGTLYAFGMIMMPDTYSKVLYCNGTSTSDPNCHAIGTCNATMINLFNFSKVIPTNDACYLTGDGSASWGVSTTEPGTILTTGFTYLFVSHFSGGVGSNDFGPPNATILTPTPDLFNTSTATSRLINFTVADADSTGLNLTANDSINVTIIRGSTIQAVFSFRNSTSTNLSCDSVTDRLSLQNTTNIACNVTFAFTSNGTYVINVSGRDTSNNSNAMNLTTSFTRITVDTIPPVIRYLNFTHNASYTTDGSAGSSAGAQLGIGDENSSAQGRTIFGVANWTDNLTQPLRGLLQFYNTSSASWITLNLSGRNATVSDNVPAYNNSGLTNFSFPIPSGHNLFEGQNVSFRIIANDTVGNINNSNSVQNFTIQINDTTKPILLISSVAGQAVLNFTNTTNPTPTIVWNITENSALKNISIQFDSLTDTTCNQYKAFSTQTAANGNRNGSLTLLDTAGVCAALSNGTHTATLTSEDVWGNREVYIHQFNIVSGPPALTLVSLSNGLSAITQSNVTASTGLTFQANVQTGSTLKNMSFTSSCNSTVQLFNATSGGTGNNTPIYPFNYSVGTCKSTTSNQTVTVTVADIVGNSNSTTFTFLVDDVGPSLTTNLTDGFSSQNNVTFSLTAQDLSQNVSSLGYFLDQGISTSTFNSLLNGTGQTSFAGQSSITVFSLNFTAGKHTIKFTSNDSLGNVQNSSLITFTAQGPTNFDELNNSLGSYNGAVNISYVSLTNASGSAVTGNSTVTGQTLNLLMALNASQGKVVNITLSFNASAANWDRYNFSVKQNNTAVRKGIENNESLKIIEIASFNSSIEEFIADSGYYGKVVFPMAPNSTDIGGTVKIQWYSNATNFRNPTNVTVCSASFAPSIGGGFITPCWNNTDNQSINVFVPHFSHVVLANDTIPPFIINNSPSANQTVISFAPNITVSQDTKNCTYSYNDTVTSTSQISMTLIEDPLISTCLGSQITNLTNGTTANITFYVYDTSGNFNQSSFIFGISDLTPPNISSITISGVTDTAATVTIVSNESINATTNSTGSNSFTNVGSNTFAATKTLSLSSLTASKAYNLTVITCDRANNCQTNLTLGFTTSAAAAAAAAASTTSSSSGGSAVGVVGTTTTTANQVASAERQWDSITAGASATLTINNPDIAVTGVSIEVQNTVSNPDIKVASLSSNPIATAAAAKVYQYLQFTKTNIADTDASKITINFKVPKSWLTTNGVSEDKVVLYRYSDNNWNGLSTTKTGSDADNVWYQSTTPGFSTFAIGSTEAMPVVTPPPAVIPPPVKVTPPPAVIPPGVVQQTVQQVKKAVSSAGIVWIVVLVIVIVAVIGYAMWRKKKSGEM